MGQGGPGSASEVKGRVCHTQPRVCQGLTAIRLGWVWLWLRPIFGGPTAEAGAQDVAIAHGYNNLQWTVPKTITVGSELPLNQLTEQLRMECAMAGFTEILTWALCSRAENFGHLRRGGDGNAVSIGNPATAEFEVCRTSLLPGALLACPYRM